MVDNREFSEQEHFLSGLIHDFGLGILSPYTAADMQKFIDSEQLPNLRAYQKILPKAIRNGIFQKWNENKQYLDRFLSYEELLFQVKDHREDLIEIIEDPKARRWINGFIKFLGLIITEDFVTT